MMVSVDFASIYDTDKARPILATRKITFRYKIPERQNTRASGADYRLINQKENKLRKLVKFK